MKKFSLVIIAFFAISSVFSQSFMHGAGVSVFISHVKSSGVAAYGGFTYSPRFNFLESENMSLSVGVPLSIGTSGSYTYNSRYGYTSEDNTIRFMVNVPLIVNVNMGAGSTQEDESRFGFFVGGGFGYNYGNFNVLETDQYGNEFDTAPTFGTYGPAGNIGFRIAVGSNQKNIETRLSYMKGINEYKPSLYGVAALFNF